MEGSEDPNNLTSTLHNATTATEPLLSKPPYPTLDPPLASTSASGDQSQYLFISYNYGPRSLKDLPFLILFSLLVLCTFGFGIFASVNRNSHYGEVNLFVYDDVSQSCTILRDYQEEPTSLNSSKSNLFSTLYQNSASKSNLVTASDVNSDPKSNLFSTSHEKSAPTSFLFSVLHGNSTFFRIPSSLNSSKLSLSSFSLQNSTFSRIPSSSNSSKSSLSSTLHENSTFSQRPSSLNSSKLNLSSSLHENSAFSSKSSSSNSLIIGSSFFFGDSSSLTSSKWSLFSSLIENQVLLRVVNASSSSVLKSLIWTLVITLILSLPFVLFILWLLKSYTKQIVYASLPFFVIIPVFINIYWFVACIVSSKCSDVLPLGYRILILVFIFLIIGVIIWVFLANWHRIELTIRIISVASNALSKNLGLFGVLPALTLGLFVYYAPIVVFLIFARMNGKIVGKEKHGEFYCAWKQDRWVPAYYALAILMMLWSLAAMVEAQVYVISGTIAQWYFSKDEMGPKRAIRHSLRNAFGPSSGTICFSSLLICIIRLVRSIVDNAREDEPGIVNLFLRCCVNIFLYTVEFLNKFTINFVAITGEAYCTAARMTYELLKRNLLSAVVVETVSTRILGGIVFVLSAIYAIVVCVILKTVIHLGVDAYFVAVMAWILLIVIMGFFVHLLDNVIDTVYICYAIDRDRGEVYKQDVHEVYVHLPISRNHRPDRSRIVV